MDGPPKVLGIKAAFLLFLAVAMGTTSTASSEEMHCSLPLIDISNDWNTMKRDCSYTLMRIGEAQSYAASLYVTMFAHFLQDDVNRPGLAQFYLQLAKVMRNDLEDLLDFLTESGVNLPLRSPEIPANQMHWESAVSSLKTALTVEEVSKQALLKAIKGCSDDFTSQEFIKNRFLAPQSKRLKDLASRIVILERGRYNHGAFAEFLYDKSLGWL